MCGEELDATDVTSTLPGRGAVGAVEAPEEDPPAAEERLYFAQCLGTWSMHFSWQL